MKLAVRVLSVCCLAVLLGATPAQDKKSAKKAKNDPLSAAFAMPKKITLDEKQQAKLEELKKEYTPKLKELFEKLDKILTPERVKAADAARDVAVAEGKKKKELTELYEQALKLSAEEKAQRKEIQAALKKLQAEIRTKKIDLLTEEQKDAFKPKPKEKKPAESDKKPPEKKTVK
jgi:hypothetical protein